MNSSVAAFLKVGHITETSLLPELIAITELWGWKLIKLSCKDSPMKALKFFSEENCLIQLSGDAAMTLNEEGSWLEALGAWKIPVILIVGTNESGLIPGDASAYVSLCEQLSVPILGLVQLGGQWDERLRKIDGLPWVGKKSKIDEKSNIDSLEGLDFEAEEHLLINTLKARFNEIKRIN